MFSFRKTWHVWKYVFAFCVPVWSFVFLSQGILESLCSCRQNLRVGSPAYPEKKTTVKRLHWEEIKNRFDKYNNLKITLLVFVTCPVSLDIYIYFFFTKKENHSQRPQWEETGNRFDNYDNLTITFLVFVTCQLSPIFFFF